MPQRFQDVAVYEKGEDVVIKIPFTGHPKPTVKWTRDGNELKVSSVRRESDQLVNTDFLWEYLGVLHMNQGCNVSFPGIQKLEFSYLCEAACASKNMLRVTNFYLGKNIHQNLE